MRVILIGNGDIKDYGYTGNILQSTDYIICCDGGMRHAIAMDIVPDLIVGDFDSASAEDIACFREKGVKSLTFPVNKDKTDLQIGLEYAIQTIQQQIESDQCEIILLACIGSRFDHTLANMGLLKIALDYDIKACIMNECNTIYLIDKEICLEFDSGGYISLIPFGGDVQGVCTQGLIYPLYDATLKLGDTMGVSNEAEGVKACVSIRKGLLFVICSRD